MLNNSTYIPGEKVIKISQDFTGFLCKIFKCVSIKLILK